MEWLKIIAFDVPMWLFQEGCIKFYESFGWEVDNVEENLFFLLGILCYILLITLMIYLS